MTFAYKNWKTSAECRVIMQEPEFNREFYGKDKMDKSLTICWNRGASQKVCIDDIDYDFPEDHILCLMTNQSFHFAHPEDIIAWQFNRDFYCIENHDQEVSCVGFLFYGSGPMMFIKLNEEEKRKLNVLINIFEEEFSEIDDIQEDMLRMLLKRLIIIVTRIAKKQFINKALTDSKLDILRQYNLLVEHHYKTEHKVKFYAEKLNRSPKTLSNYFALYNHQPPLMVIQNRIFLQAKRLLIYTNKSSKEVAYELGFEDVAYFSNFFKKMALIAPSLFRKNKNEFNQNTL
jgi:AraC-like DNA-binding protein